MAIATQHSLGKLTKYQRALSAAIRRAARSRPQLPVERMNFKPWYHPAQIAHSLKLFFSDPHGQLQDIYPQTSLSVNASGRLDIPEAETAVRLRMDNFLTNLVLYDGTGQKVEEQRNYSKEEASAIREATVQKALDFLRDDLGFLFLESFIGDNSKDMAANWIIAFEKQLEILSRQLLDKSTEVRLQYARSKTSKAVFLSILSGGAIAGADPTLTAGFGLLAGVMNHRMKRAQSETQVHDRADALSLMKAQGLIRAARKLKCVKGLWRSEADKEQVADQVYSDILDHVTKTILELYENQTRFAGMSAQSLQDIIKGEHDEADDVIDVADLKSKIKAVVDEVSAQEDPADMGEQVSLSELHESIKAELKVIFKVAEHIHFHEVVRTNSELHDQTYGKQVRLTEYADLIGPTVPFALALMAETAPTMAAALTAIFPQFVPQGLEQTAEVVKDNSSLAPLFGAFVIALPSWFKQRADINRVNRPGLAGSDEELYARVHELILLKYLGEFSEFKSWTASQRLEALAKLAQSVEADYLERVQQVTA